MYFRPAMTSFLGSFSNFFLSIVLGAFAMGTFWYYYPDQFVQLQRSASIVREWIVAHSWSARSESIFRFLLEDRQLLLVAFVLAIRFVLGIVVLPFRALLSRD